MREVVRGDKHNLRKSANCKAQISSMCGVNDTDLCVAIFSGCVCHLEQLHAQSPFLFPIVFSINHYFNRQKVLTQWTQPSLHYPRSYHHLFFIGTNSMFACFQMYVKSTFFLFFFFFHFHMIFFSPQTCVDSVGATIFTFPVVIQLNVFIAVPNHFVFWKSKVFFLQVST